MSKNLKYNIHKKTKVTLVGKAAIFSMIVFIGSMIIVVFHNLVFSPMNAAINSLSQSSVSTVPLSEIEGATANAISSTNLIMAIEGIFMTCVSVFAALIVFIANAKIEDVDEKINTFQLQLNNEAYLRHVIFGIDYKNNKKYIYALKEYKDGLDSEDNECRLIANYYTGLLYDDMYELYEIPECLGKAVNHLNLATQFESGIDPIISSDSHATLGCIYGLMAEGGGPYHNDYLNRSEELLIKAIKIFPFSVYYKNLAITYAFKGAECVNEAVKCIKEGIILDTEEKEMMVSKDNLKINAAIFMDKLYNETEKTIIPDVIRNNISNKINEWDYTYKKIFGIKMF